ERGFGTIGVRIRSEAGGVFGIDSEIGARGSDLRLEHRVPFWPGETVVSALRRFRRISRFGRRGLRNGRGRLCDRLVFPAPAQFVTLGAASCSHDGAEDDVGPGAIGELVDTKGF